MLCSKCNAELIEGAKFCSSCGSKVEVTEEVKVELPVEETPAEAAPVEEKAVEESPAEEKSEEKPEEAPTEEKAEEAPAEEKSAEESTEEKSAEESPTEKSEEAPTEEKSEGTAPTEEKAEEAPAPAEEPIPTPVLPTVTPDPENNEKSSLKKLIPKAGALVVAGAILGVLVTMLGKGGDNSYVYLSGGSYNLMTDAKKGDGFEFASSKSSTPYSGNVKFTEDGKYIYFLTKVSYDDNYNTTGTLCRAQVKKLKKNSKKNEKYIETIATSVCLGFDILDNGDVVYQNSDGNLYYYNGKDSTTIAKDVNYFSCEDDYLIMASDNGSSGTDIYYVSYKKPEEKEKIASKCSSVLSYKDKDDIVYTKYEDDYTYSIYKTGLGKDAEKIASHADLYYITDMFSGEEPCFYYSVESDKSISLYDYVNDSFADADKDVVEPDINNYTIPTYSYNMISDKNPKESDYGELYTSCTQGLYWYGMSKYWCDSMDEAVDKKWGDQTDNIVKATQSFMDKYASKADENGYIPVTEDVKAALKEINKYGSDSIAKEKNAENQWLWLCFSKEQSGNTYDYDRYDEDYEKYRKVADRLYTREHLQDKDNDIKVKSLYYYKDGKSNLICDNIVDTREYSNVLVYNTADMVTEKMDIEDVEYYSEIRDLFRFSYEKNNSFVSSVSSEPVQLSDKVSEKLADYEDSFSMSLYAVGEDLVLYYDDELYFAPIKKGKTDSFSLLTDDGTVLAQRDDKLYYGSDVSKGNVVKGDICTFEDGKIEKLVSDVILNDVNIYEDGSILAYTDLRSSIYYELSFFDKKGKKTVVADDVTQYIRLSKKDILYIANGELTVYSGSKKKNKAADGVEYVWAKNEMEPEITINAGVYGWLF